MKEFEISLKDLYPSSEIKEGKLFGVVAGPSDGVPVVFLHGRKFTSKNWVDSKILEEVAQKGYLAIAIDTPGFGKSDPCVLVPDQGEFVPDFLQAFLTAEVVKTQLGLTKEAVLVFPSMAGHYMWPLFGKEQKWKGIVSAVATIAPAKVAPEVSALENSPSLPPFFTAWGEHDQKTQSDRPLLQKALSKCEVFDDVVIKDANHPAYLNQPQAYLTSFCAFLAKVCHA